MIPTPEVDHVRRIPYLDRVYVPAEDTFALLDALEQDADDLRSVAPRLVVEIGSGSGCVSSFVASILAAGTGKQEAAFICTDINLLALQATSETGRRNGDVVIDAVRSSLLQALLPRCKGKIDLLLFNPPYVPTTEEEEREAQAMTAIEGSWAGGTLGTKLVEALMPCLADVITPGGRFYLVAIKQNDPDLLVRELQAIGFVSDICLSRKAGREHLYIIRAKKPI